MNFIWWIDQINANNNWSLIIYKTIPEMYFQDVVFEMNVTHHVDKHEIKIGQMVKITIARDKQSDNQNINLRIHLSQMIVSQIGYMDVNIIKHFY